MTKKIASSRSTTLDLLLNTLATFLGWLKERNEVWERHRKAAILRRKYYRGRWASDLVDWDILNERIVYNDGLVVVETLVSNLIVVLESNPFPGEKKRVLEIAQELFPGARVILYPKVVLKGEKLWLEIFEIGGIEHRERLRFPVKLGEIDVAEVEKLLYERVREDNTILATEVPKVLNVDARSKTYQTIKVQLEERNWCWKQRKEGGKVVKIVVAPR